MRKVLMLLAMIAYGLLATAVFYGIYALAFGTWS